MSTEDSLAEENSSAEPENQSDDCELVTISRWELDALRAQVEQTESRPTEGGSRENLLQQTGRLSLVTEDKRTVELELAYRAAVRDRELATALAGRPLVPGAAAQLIKLLRDDFDVIEEAGEFRVVARDGRAVAKAVSDRLGETDFSHFVLPSTRGGTALRSSPKSSGTESYPPPRNLGEVALQRWRESSLERGESANKPIGLRRR